MEERDARFASAAIKKNDRVLVLNAGEGLLVWEALRLAPDGYSLALVDTQAELDSLSEFAQRRDSLRRPGLALAPEAQPETLLASAEKAAGFDPRKCFEKAVGRGAIREIRRAPALFLALRELLAEGATVAFSVALPGAGTRLSDLLGTGPEGQALAPVEREFYEGLCPGDSEAFFTEALSQAGFSHIEITIRATEARRAISPAELEAWFAPSSRYGSFIATRLDAESLQAIKAKLCVLSTRAEGFSCVNKTLWARAVYSAMKPEAKRPKAARPTDKGQG
jgi:putative ATPase